MMGAIVAKGGGGRRTLLRTGADGRALFLSGFDDPEGARELVMSLVRSSGGPAVVRTVSSAAKRWEITLASAEDSMPGGLDLAFVIDATGSMADELSYLQKELSSISSKVGVRFPGTSVRFGLVVYRDVGDDYVTRAFDFTSSLPQFLPNLKAQSAQGGGDYPEAMHSALAKATKLSWARGAGVRMLFLVADAPPHSNKGTATLDQMVALRGLGVKLYPVAASGVLTDAEYMMRVGSLSTLGRYLFLTDDSGVGHSHAEPHIPCYHVETLADLMTRMISSELSGRLVPPAKDRIIRTVGRPVDGVCK